MTITPRCHYCYTIIPYKNWNCPTCGASVSYWRKTNGKITGFGMVRKALFRDKAMDWTILPYYRCRDCKYYGERVNQGFLRLSKNKCELHNELIRGIWLVCNDWASIDMRMDTF